MNRRGFFKLLGLLPLAAAAKAEEPFVPDLSGTIAYGYMMQTYSHWEVADYGKHLYTVNDPCSTQGFSIRHIYKTVIYDGRSFVDLNSPEGRQVIIKLSQRP